MEEEEGMERKGERGAEVTPKSWFTSHVRNAEKHPGPQILKVGQVT